MKSFFLYSIIGSLSLLFFVNSAFADAPELPVISSPTDGSIHPGIGYIHFEGSCIDTEDGEDEELIGDALKWRSSQNGAIGTGQNIDVNTLQSGEHTITLTATDSESLSSSTNIDITVLNHLPTSTITSPPNRSSFNAGHSVTFSGIGTDIDSGDTLSYSWTSSIASPPEIGTESIIAVANLAVGTHVIILTVSDGNTEGTTASTPITIEITNNAPSATISNPSTSSSFYENTPVSFSGSGFDTEDGALSDTSLVWESSRDGNIGTGSPMTTSILSAGIHSIVLIATDSENASTRSTPITITIGNASPVAVITAPPDGTSYDMDDVIVFQGSATDREDGNLSGSYLVWTSSIDNNIGEGANITTNSLTSGTHVITLTATDLYSTPKTGTDTIIITVSNTFPTATISNPADNSSFYENASVTFSGSGSDAEDGPLTGDFLTWTSSLDGEIGKGSPMSRDDLTAGIHTITLTATDSEKAPTISVPITISIGNAAPIADISSPVDGASYSRGDSITFRGTGTDTEDGELTGALLTWTSNLSEIIGTGTILPIDTLITGTHTITLTATDSQSATGTNSIAVSVTNNPPVVTISSPPNNSVYELSATIAFTGTATDPEDSYISGASLSWESSIDGSLGTGTSISTRLSKGSHIITLTATDSEGDTGITTIKVHVGNNPPSVSIISPATGTNYDVDEYISFQGTATDIEDGTLSGDSLLWTSSIDGNFATGLSPAQINTLSIGQHNIRLIASDSNGAVTDSAPIAVRVGNTAPVATILKPYNNQSFESGETITFEGTGIDPENGVLLTTALVWTSSRQGQIGTGTSFSINSLDSGQHTISLTVTDLDNASHTSSITIIAQNARPIVSIDTPVSGTLINEGNNITFQGTATDGEDGNLSGNSLVWTSNYDGNIGTGISFTLDTLSGGTHIITLTATDNLGLTSSGNISLSIVPMTLSASALAIEKGATGTITISGGKTPYRVATRRSQVALPSEINGSLSVRGISEGSTIITVTDNKKHSAEVNVTITDNSATIYEQLPVAEIKFDPSDIEEGERVYLSGSNTNTEITGRLSFLWTQTDPADSETPLAENTVELSDALSATPSFIAPLIGLNGGPRLAFKLTITNQNGVATVATDTIIINLKNNGITKYPPDTITFKSYNGKDMASKIFGEGELKRLTALDHYDINASALPQNMIYGIIDMKIKSSKAGDTIALVIYLPAAASKDHKWYKYIKNESTWVDFDRELISSGTGDGAVFNQDRTTVTLYITDDGPYDDNTTDSIIEDPSGLGLPPNPASDSDDESNGCFLAVPPAGLPTAKR